MCKETCLNIDQGGRSRFDGGNESLFGGAILEEQVGFHDGDDVLFDGGQDFDPLWCFEGLERSPEHLELGRLDGNLHPDGLFGLK